MDTPLRPLLPWLVASILIGLAPVALAEDEPKPSDQPEVVAFPLDEVTNEAEQLATALQGVLANAKEDPEVTRLEAELAGLEKQLADARLTLNESLEPVPSLPDLADLENLWNEAREALIERRVQVDARVRSLQATREDLATRKAQWEATLEKARAEQAPTVLAELTKETIRDLKRVDGVAAERLGLLVTLQKRLSTADRVVDDAIEEIHEVRAQLRSSVLRRDGAPLWAIERDPTAQITPGQVRAAAEGLIEEFRTYFRDEQSATGPAFAVVLATLLVFGLRRRVRLRTDGEALDEDAQLLLDRPLSMALVASIGLAFWFVESPPRGVREAIGLLLLVPALRVLSLWVPPYARNGLRALAGFYLADRVRGMLSALVELERTLLLVELAAALLLLLWLQRPGRYRKAFDRPLAHPALARLITRLATLLLAIAVAAGVFGYLGLSRLLGEGVLASAYTGVFVVGILRVFEALVGQLLRTRPVRERVRIARFQTTVVLETVRQGAGWVAALIWIHASLQFFAVRDSVYEWLGETFSQSLEVGNISISLGDVVVVVVALWLAVLLSRLIRFLLSNEVYPRLSLARGVPNALSTMLHYAFILLGISIGFGALGIDFDRLALVLGALGVGVGFGLQAIVNNFVSGLILLFERPIQVGDTIELDTTHGDVRRIGIRSSTIRTWDGAEIIVPNADLISLRVTNWTLSDRRRRIDLDVGVAYGTDPERVREILLEAARGHESVLSYPEPTAFFKAFGDSSLDFQLRVWVGDPDHWMSARSEINVRVNHALDEAGITIPFPQRDLHIQSLPPPPPAEDPDA